MHTSYWFLLLLVGWSWPGFQSHAQVTWQRTYGGFGIDEGHAIRQTSDQGFIVVGSTGSFGHGSSDVYVLKLDSNGEREWSRAIGGPSIDQGWAVQQLPDDGFVVAGFTLNGGAGGYDGLLLRLDPQGMVVWEKTYGGTEWDFLYDVTVLSDGFALTGSTTVDGNLQAWLVKVDQNGAVQWERTLGGDGQDEARSIRLTSAGDLIIAGTMAIGGLSDVFVSLWTAGGDEIWTTVIGSPDIEHAFSVVETSDHGFAIGGYKESIDTGMRAMFLAKVDELGSPVWTNQIDGGSGEWEGRSIRVNHGGGLVLAGITSSYGAGGFDFYMAQTDDLGYWISGPNYGTPGEEQCWSMDLTDDGGYVLVGTTTGIGPGAAAVLVVKNAGDVISGPFIMDFDPLEVPDRTAERGLRVAPNPVAVGATVQLWGALREDGHVTMIASDGRVTASFELNAGNRTVQLPAVRPGLYTLKLVTANGRSLVSTLVVQAK